MTLNPIYRLFGIDEKGDLDLERCGEILSSADGMIEVYHVKDSATYEDVTPAGPSYNLPERKPLGRYMTSERAVEVIEGFQPDHFSEFEEYLVRNQRFGNKQKLEVKNNKRVPNFLGLKVGDFAEYLEFEYEVK